MRLRRPIAFILSAAVAASALTGCDSFSGHAAAAANSAQIQQLIEFIADLGLERDLRQALQSGGDLRQALLTLLGLENAVNFNVDGLTGARPGQHAVQVWEVTAQSAEDAAALAASQIRAVLEQLKSNGVTAGRIGMVEVDGKYYVVVDVEVTEENTFEPIRPVSDDDDDEEQQPQEPKATLESGKLTITGGSGTLNEETIEKLLSENPNWKDSVTSINLLNSGYTQIGKPDDKYGVFQGCESLKTVILPESVTEIGSYAFWNCGSLTNINLPEGLQSIGVGAFYNCTSLTSIDLSDCTGLITIGISAFWYCTNLTSIDLPANLQTIGNNAFANSGLTSITLPAKLTTIDDYAFWGCSGLKEINLNGCTSLTTIDSYAFDGCSLTEVDLSGCTSLQTIGNYAFRNCTGLTRVTLPADLQTIGNYAFYNCSGLENITFYSAPKIGENAFKGVISDADPADKLTIHCPNVISEILVQELVNGGLAKGTYTLDNSLNPATYLLSL